jgi:hypothetical protein
MKFICPLILLAFVTSALATPILQMNRTFSAVMELLPYVLDDKEFHEKKNNEKINTTLKDLNKGFKNAGHDSLLKHDLFAPSYSLVLQNLQESQNAFAKNKKEHSRWLIKETLAVCMDCHTRLPVSHTSSFQNGEVTFDKSVFKDKYDLGVGYLIVRRYVDAKENFTQSIQDKIIKKDFADLILPFQQILLIETKVMKDPSKMVSIIDWYLEKKNLTPEVSEELVSWKKRLDIWKQEKNAGDPKNEKDLATFINRRLKPLKDDSFNNSYKVDYLIASGVLAHFYFENQASPMAPEINFWMGWIEKRLKRDEFMSSGDLFLKQCIKRYPKHPIAKDCLEEYKESLMFDFSGSSGTHIPRDLQQELDQMIDSMPAKKK